MKPDTLEEVYRTRCQRLIGIAREQGARDPADVVHDAFVMALDRSRRGVVDPRPPFKMMCTAVRLLARHIRYHRVVYEFPDRKLGVKPSVVTRLAAAETWAELTPKERIAVAQLHILEEQMTFADRNVFTSRIRLARQRLGAA